MQILKIKNADKSQDFGSLEKPVISWRDVSQLSVEYSADNNADYQLCLFVDDAEVYSALVSNNQIVSESGARPN
jgi:hypothetical protein